MRLLMPEDGKAGAMKGWFDLNRDEFGCTVVAKRESDRPGLPRRTTPEIEQLFPKPPQLGSICRAFLDALPAFSF